MKVHNIIQAVAVAIFAMSVTSCSSSIETRLNKYEKAIKKWEEKKAKGDFSSEDCIELSKDLRDMEKENKESDLGKITPEELTRAEDLSRRAGMLVFGCM